MTFYGLFAKNEIIKCVPLLRLTASDKYHKWLFSLNLLNLNLKETWNACCAIYRNINLGLLKKAIRFNLDLLKLKKGGISGLYTVFPRKVSTKNMYSRLR